MKEHEDDINEPHIDKAFSGDVNEHEYDGIKELNNPSPNWIIAIFFVTIGFSLFYAIHFFGYPNNGRDQDSEYQRKVTAFEVEKAEMQKAAAAETGELSELEIIAAGEKLYLEKGCIACHGMKGEGNAIGPNLTDHFWINGCSDDAIVKIITEGKPEKGMTPYKAMMSAEQIKSVKTFIQKKLVGSNPENPKAAQGEECK